MKKQYTKPEPLKYLFKISEHPNALEIAKKEKIEVRISNDGVYACACFDNTIDYHQFRAALLHS